MKRATSRASIFLLPAAMMVGLPSVPSIAAPATAPAAGATADADAGARAQAVIDKGLAYLKAQQKPDGSWQGETDPPALTAIVLKAFAQDPKTGAKADFVKKGYDKLLSYQLEDGGIYKDLLANYNTAIAVSALAAAENPEYKPRIEKAVAYLKGLQWTEKTPPGPKGEKVDSDKHPWYGGSGYSKKGRPDGSNSQLAMDALKDAGLKSDDPAFQAAAKFNSRLQNNSETNDQPFAKNSNDGGAIYSPANDGESMAGEYTGPDGKRMLRSYGSMTYAMLKSYMYAGLKKDDARVKAAWDWVTKNYTVDENPGMRLSGPDAQQSGLYYYFQTMARALNAYDEPIVTDAKGVKHDWRIDLVNKLASTQKPDGSWVGEKRWMESNPTLATSHAILALQEVKKDLAEYPAK